MRRTFTTEPKHVSMRGLAGSNRIRFLATIEHGRGTREVAVDVHPDLIVKIAAALIATKDCACDSKWQREHRHHSEMGWQSGHAMWHIDNPDMPMPCINHDSVIDVIETRSLPASATPGATIEDGLQGAKR